jgi:hypothetical protein
MRGVVVTVDYAETRTIEVGRLIGAALATRVPVRILLLARQTACGGTGCADHPAVRSMVRASQRR